jgi:predicted Fe-S protein YdhL (DUF1289 family)
MLIFYKDNPVVESPCVNWCEMDPITGLCFGCSRTIDEIARWSALSDDQQCAINQQLPLRKSPNSDGAPSAQLP